MKTDACHVLCTEAGNNSNRNKSNNTKQYQHQQQMWNRIMGCGQVKSSSGCSGQGLPSHQHTVEGVLLEGDIGEGLPDGHVMHVGADGFLDMGEMDHVCGARQEDIDKLRTEVLKSVAALGSQSTCLICQEDFASGASVAWLPCGHVMHKACAQKWFEVSRQCPVCKTSIGE
mmetsp:Transcript_60236/g.108452  ORF Transcript_60236/g.108452 Transcript_60236/m.108452 type:complete len:172 (+) Transcript_60236:1-516(+)